MCYTAFSKFGIFLIGRYKTMSKKTKTTLVTAFLELVNEEPFDKITVTDLVEKCSISRQTFYYHFDDIKEMLEWAFDSETKAICDTLDYDNWQATEDRFVEFLNKYDMLFRKSLVSTKFIFIFNMIDKSFNTAIKHFISAKRSEEQNFGKNADYVISYTAGAFTSLVVKTIQNETSDYETIVKNLSTSLQGI